MGWVWLDDGLTEHPKVAALSSDGLALFIASLCYSNRRLTDGFIPRGVGLGQLWECDGNPIPGIRELERSGLWEPAEAVEHGDQGTGWLIHDYHQYQQSRADAELRMVEHHQRKIAAGHKRARDADRDKAGRFRRSHPATPADGPAHGPAASQQTSSPTPTPTPTRATERTEAVSTSNSPLLAPRERDAIWDGFAEWLHRQPETSSERGAWNKAAKELRDIGVTDPADIISRGRAYERNYPTITWTPNGLVKHWSELIRPPWVAIRPTQEAPPETCDYGEGVVCGRCGSVHGPLSIS
jgi:hypothetical protein